MLVITLGCLVGADLLHLKDVKPEQAIGNLNIGGGGIRDCLAVSGLYTLLVTEFILKVLSWLKI